MCAVRKPSARAKSAPRRSSTLRARPVVLVTGLSGAGLSTALKALEDLGYQAIDNLPLALVPALLKQKRGATRPLAIGIDSRTWDFSARSLATLVRGLRRQRKLAVSVLFIDCQDSALQQRFTETRRVHPLAIDRPVADGVARDRSRSAPVRDIADQVIDTTDLTARDFRRMLTGHYALEQAPDLQVFVTSFGFKHGLPRNADMVFDVRFLANPHWQPRLRPLTGRDPAVADYIRGDEAYAAFFVQLTALLSTLLPRYRQEGRHYLTIAIGCTGGQHRSVFTAEQLGAWLNAQGHTASISHRDIDSALVSTSRSHNRKTSA